MHVDEEQLQRLVDAELAEPADEWVSEHLVHCESCREKVDRAKTEQNEVFALLGNLDHPRPPADHAALMARGRARGSTWMTKAAGFVVAAALAGAAYAAPGSPLPTLVARVFGDGGPAPPVVQNAIPKMPVVSGVTVATGNRMVITFATTQTTGEIRVTLSNDAEIEVRAVGTGASFTAGEEVLTIDNANSRADFAITIPRRAPLVEIRIGGNRVFLKDGTRIATDRTPTGVDTWIIPLNPERVASSERLTPVTIGSLACSSSDRMSNCICRGGIVRAPPITATAVLAAFSIACSDATSPASPPYTPVLPTSWAASVTNTYFPLLPGTTWQYKEQTASGGETITVEVLNEKRMVSGVSATVVRDRVFKNGQLIEDTFDWYAQDSEGNVWYVGEATKEYKNGVVVSTEGSWEWGVDGALPGIQMWANPAAKIGAEYRQEYYKGQAEDWGKVITVGQSITVPFGSANNCITIEEWAGLEPNSAHETKSYCPQVGLVSEGTVGQNGRVELLSKTP